MNNEFILNKIIYIQSQNADAAPPLGTILGNIGVNTVKFCDEFNKLTIKLPIYFVVKVKIIINENRSFNFNIISLSISNIFKLLKFKNIIKEKEIVFIKLKNVIILSIFKFPNINIEESINILFGIAKSMNIIIVK